MMRILAIVAAAVLAVIAVTMLVGQDEGTESLAEGSEVDQLAEPPTADIVDEEGGADAEPVEELGEEPVPAADQTTTEAMTDEVEEETVPAAEGTEPEVVQSDVGLAEEVETEAEAKLGTELAGSAEGLERLDALLTPEGFDYDAVQEAISNSDLEQSRKDQLANALEKANPYRPLRDALLEDIRADLGLD
ncbi:hypothetical protein [Limimaricola pyoseonensis]|uniref:Uncharacterized protein n=1 Tax=Limimaricola pyoseonensis TaxID=521013 RepID=A0A1G7H2R5_9RHOB|nr:hypothetical protein [Limimaricola pyoseonensis]SDE94706.1 hypothetical protein SAMN04488567_3052 [Limimaricola pyoseonensis]